MSTAEEKGLFRQVLGHLPTGVVIVAAPGPVGAAIGSFFSISLDPPLVGFCIGIESSTWPAIHETGVFCASVLADDQEHVSRQLSISGSDKFVGVGYDTVATGSPRLHGCVAWVDCDIQDVLRRGDHDIVTGRVREMSVGRDGKPLVFHRGGYATVS